MKIGILTYHRSHNFGAYLQAYALCNRIKEELGCDIEIIDYTMGVVEKYYIKAILDRNFPFTLCHNVKRYIAFKKALRDLPISSESLISNKIEKFQEYIRGKYDIIITGSDEVWKLDGMRGFPNAYWLPGNLGVKKVSYAVSSRSDFNLLTEDKKTILKEYIDSFEYMGVRDQTTFDNVYQYTQNKDRVFLNCDPTFIYDFKPNPINGREILRKRFGADVSKKCIGIMSANEEIVQAIINKYGNKYSCISLFKKFSNTKHYGSLTPFEWVDVISALDFLATTFFHGMCFALKSNIPFVVMECRKTDKITSKSFDLLSKNDLLQHFCMKEDKDKYDRIFALIDENLEGTAQAVNYEKMIASQKSMFESFICFLKKEEQNQRAKKI